MGIFIFLLFSLSFVDYFSFFLQNFGSWVYRLMIQFIVASSFFLQDYISFIFSLVFFFSLLFWSCSFPFKMNSCVITLRVSEIHLFYNLLLFYWHFLEILWLYIFLLFYKYEKKKKKKKVPALIPLL